MKTKKNLSAKAILLLRRVAKHILEEPRRYDQNVWLSREASLHRDNPPPCGTIGCIAGWTCVLGDSKAKSDYEGAARKLLGLSVDSASTLFAPVEPDNFYAEEGDASWPKRFVARYRRATTSRDRARIAADRIEHFIKTDGKE